MTWPPRCPDLILALRLNQGTVHGFVLLFLPPCGPHLIPLATGPLEPSLLVCSTPGGPSTWTFRACSSPAPTPIKLQPAPAILSQESVHQRCQSLITLGSDHPLVLEPHRSSTQTPGMRCVMSSPSCAMRMRMTSLLDNRDDILERLRK
jgi:hypothetical protein